MNLALLTLTAWLIGFGEQAPVRIDVPILKQPYNLCLAASVSMVLRYWGMDLSPKEIANHVPVYRDGTTGRDLQRFVEERGFRGFMIEPPFADLLDHMRKGRPPVIAVPARGKSRHAMVLTGFDADKQLIFLNDPAGGRKRTLDYKTFQRQWEAARRWTFLIVPR